MAGDRALLEFRLYHAARLREDRGEVLVARAYFERKRELSQELGYRLGVSIALHGLQRIDRMAGDYAAQRRHNEESLRIECDLGSPAGIAEALRTLAVAAREVGDLERAIALHQEAMPLVATLGWDRVGQARHMCHYVLTLVEGCRLDIAATVVAEYRERLHGADVWELVARLSAAQSIQDYRKLLWANSFWRFSHAWLNLTQGNMGSASEQFQQLLEQVRNERALQLDPDGLEEHGIVFALTRCALLRKDLAEAHAHLDWLLTPKQARKQSVYKQAEAQLELAWTRLASGDPALVCEPLMTSLQRFAQIRARLGIARSLECAAASAAEQGVPHKAVRLWSAAAALREQLSAPMWPVERPDYECRVGDARAVVGDDAFEAAWQAGQALRWERAVTDALTGLTTSLQS
jgi:hypothetical protein